MFFKGVFINVESETCVEVLKEYPSHIVALAYDDGVLLGELSEVGERGAEHRVSGYIRMTRLLIIVLQPSLDGRDVADDAVSGNDGHHLLEGWYGVL